MSAIKTQLEIARSNAERNVDKLAKERLADTLLQVQSLQALGREVPAALMEKLELFYNRVYN